MPAPRRPSPLVALLLVGAVGSLPAQAPTVRDTVRLGPVVVTATKTDGAPAVAATVVLRGAALRERGIATVGDALREVAGVHLARSGSPGATTSLFLRGGQSNYVKVLVDGVSVNEAGGFVDAANLGTDNVERIEVVRGPTSVLYGSDAVSGVVQIFTRRPASGLHVDAAVRGGATPRKRGRPDDATPADGRSALLDATVEASGGTSRLGWSIGAARREHGGLLAFNNAWRHTAASAALVASPDARTMLRLSTRLTDGRFEYPTDGGGFAVDSNARRDERRVVLGLDAERRLGERVRLRLLAGTHELHGVSSDQPDSRADTAGFYYRTENDNWRRTLESRLEVRLRDAAALALGVEGQWQHEESHGASRFGSFEDPPSTFDEGRRNVGWFAQLAGSTRIVDYSAGARLDDNEKFGTFGTWRGGASVRLPHGSRIRASVGTAFREPSFVEVFNTAYTRGNATLRPERSASWEVGVEHTTAWLALAATWFDQRFRDMIQYRGQPATSRDPHYFNVARAASRGLELELRTDEERPLVATASLTALRTRVLDAGFQTDTTDTFVEGRRLLRRPDRQASVGLGWRPTRSARLDATVLRVGTREDRDFTTWTPRPVTLGAYTRLDLSGEIDLLPRRAVAPLTLTLRAENALDAGYEEIVNYAAPGRTVFVGVRARWGTAAR